MTFSTWLSMIPPSVTSFCRHIERHGGMVWLVGGCVRDMYRGETPKDFDVEVYGIAQDNLWQLCCSLGHCEAVGKQFGVFKLFLNDVHLDIALPRRESKIQQGHKGFDVQPDPYLTPEKAALRRDFTINSMMFDPLRGKLVDDYGGACDLQQRCLRHVSPAFAEDPLRPLRGMQFAARFDLQMDKETAALCRNLRDEAVTLPASRIWQEWQKWAHAEYPQAGLKVLQHMQWLALYPELTALIDCPQNPRWHPEGNVWIHTQLVCQQAARIATREQLDAQQREILLFAALCHDLGKPLASITDEQGQIRSPGHSESGLQPTDSFLQRICAPAYIAKHVLPLVHEHIVHLSGQPTARAVRRLAHRLEPATIELWEMLVEADASGRTPAPASRPAIAWLKQAQLMQVQKQKPKPYLNGKILMQQGVMPGKRMGHILKVAYEAQLDGEIQSKEDALSWYRQYAHDMIAK